jgi:hypothetical protein
LKPLLLLSLLFGFIACAWAADGRISGRLTDTQGKSVAGAKLRLRAAPGGTTAEAASDPE